MSNNKALLNSPRLQRVHASDLIYYYSLKHQSIVTISKDDFRLNKSIACELCIPVYRYRAESRKPCVCKFTKLSQFKNHIVHCENQWKRELAWSTESEIPLDLEREREIGDLASLHDADILKVEFNGQTLICFRNSILPYFKKNACPCKNEYGQFGVEPCSTRVGSSYLHLFTHLSHLEKLFRRYMVFKGNINELDGQFTVKPNDKSSVNGRKISKSDLRLMSRRVGRPPKFSRLSLPNQSATSSTNPQSSTSLNRSTNPQSSTSLSSSTNPQSSTNLTGSVNQQSSANLTSETNPQSSTSLTSSTNLTSSVNQQSSANLTSATNQQSSTSLTSATNPQSTQPIGGAKSSVSVTPNKLDEPIKKKRGRPFKKNKLTASGIKRGRPFKYVKVAAISSTDNTSIIGSSVSRSSLVETVSVALSSTTNSNQKPNAISSTAMNSNQTSNAISSTITNPNQTPNAISSSVTDSNQTSNVVSSTATNSNQTSNASSSNTVSSNTVSSNTVSSNAISSNAVSSNACNDKKESETQTTTTTKRIKKLVIGGRIVEIQCGVESVVNVNGNKADEQLAKKEHLDHPEMRINKDKEVEYVFNDGVKITEIGGNSGDEKTNESTQNKSCIVLD